MKTIKATLLYIVKEEKVLLGKKLRGFGKGNYNGIGGKVDFGETIEQGMIREVKEEICVEPVSYELVGKIVYNEFMDGEPVVFETFVYVATGYVGDIKDTDEMEPSWFDINRLPFDKMFGDDSYWLPQVLLGEKIVAEFDFDKDFNILNYNVKTVDVINLEESENG